MKSPRLFYRVFTLLGVHPIKNGMDTAITNVRVAVDPIGSKGISGFAIHWEGRLSFFEKCSTSLRHHASKILPGLWGVTLPMINGSSPDWLAGRDLKIEL